MHLPVDRPVQLVHDLGGRDPRFLRPGVPHQARRAAGPLRDAVVHEATSRAPITCSAPSSAAPTTPHDRRDRRDAGPTIEHWLEQNGVDNSLVAAGQARCSCATAAAAAMARRQRHGARAPLWRASTAAPCRSPTAASCGADDRYIRDSILLPEKQVVAELRAASCRPSPDRSARTTSLKLIAYIKSLGPRDSHEHRPSIERP